MAEKADIGAKIAVDGEKQFRDSIKAIDAEIKALNAEMKESETAFDDMGDSEEHATTKSELLAESYRKQEEKLGVLSSQFERSKSNLDALGEQLERAKKEFGENSTEAGKAQNAYNRQATEVNNLRSKMAEARTAMADVEQQMRDMNTPTKELGENLEKAGEKGEGFGGKIGAVFAGNVLADAVGALAGKVTELVGAFFNLDEATAEYRENMGKTETAFESAGLSAEDAETTYRQFYAILGDSDTAAESAQLLAQLAQGQEDLSKWTTISTGVVGTFGDALPINSLIEASNETAKVGQVTGVLADALNWVGISEDAFNEKLAACGSEQERNQLITETLSQTYADAASTFEENNSAMMTARDLQAQMDEAMAGLGETVQNTKNTLLAEFLPSIVDVTNSFNDFINGADNADVELQESVENMVSEITEKLPEFLDFGINILIAIAKGVIESLPTLLAAAPDIIATLVGGLASLLWELVTMGGDLLGSVVEGITDKISGMKDMGIDMVKGLWEGISNSKEWIKEKIRGWVGNVTDFLKGLFGIHSPSTVMRDEVGVYLAQGIGVGFEQEMKKVSAQMGRAVPTAFDVQYAQEQQVAQGQGLVESVLNGLGTMQNRAVNVIAQVVLPNGEVLAETIFQDLLNVSRQRGVRFAGN